jgi:hypothetical protein
MFAGEPECDNHSCGGEAEAFAVGHEVVDGVGCGSGRVAICPRQASADIERGIRAVAPCGSASCHIARSHE